MIATSKARNAGREVAQVLLEAANHSDDDTEGYSEGAEDFSCGIEMPLSVAGGGNDPQSSGNVTPVQTLGELEDISVEEVELHRPLFQSPESQLLSSQRLFPEPKFSTSQDDLRVNMFYESKGSPI